jgi:hypothetical protein
MLRRLLLDAPSTCRASSLPRHLLAAPPPRRAAPPCHTACSPHRPLPCRPPCSLRSPCQGFGPARLLTVPDQGSSPSGLLTEPGLLPSSSPCRSSADSSLCQIGQGALPTCHSGGPSFLVLSNRGAHPSQSPAPLAATASTDLHLHRTW